MGICYILKILKDLHKIVYKGMVNEHGCYINSAILKPSIIFFTFSESSHLVAHFCLVPGCSSYVY